MTKLIEWLKGLFAKEIKMSEALADLAVGDAPPATDAVTTLAQPIAPAITSPLELEKAVFADLVSFVEHGIEKLGKDAEAELVTLAKKYL